MNVMRNYVYVIIFCAILTIAFLLIPFPLKIFSNPSESMLPTLEPGKNILVFKLSFGNKTPQTNSKLYLGSNLERGDIVVFRYPLDESQYYVKRLIGLPGDRISYMGKHLGVNGKKLGLSKGEIFKSSTRNSAVNYKKGCAKLNAKCQVLIETIEQISYTIMIDPEVLNSISGEITVPESKYFVMGDNRDYSSDSRLWGFVSDRNIIGKAIFTGNNDFSLDSISEMLNHLF